VTSTTYEPTYDEQYLSKVDYDLWLGPAAKRPFNRNRFHYNWHWHWDYGNGDSGNQGPHQFDIARWGCRSRSTRSRSDRPAATSATSVAGDAEHADELFEYADGAILEFGTRGGFTNDEGSVEDRQPVLRHEGLAVDRGERQEVAVVLRTEERERARAPTPAERASRPGSTTTEYPHYQNFIDAIRADDPKC
jgi:predicted dehydrogenase